MNRAMMVPALAAALVAPLAGVPSTARAATQTTWLLAFDAAPARATRPQSYWRVNLQNRGGMLLGVSPVAAKVRLDNGTVRTFSIAHPEYERLRAEVGDYISFDVRHDVLEATSG